MTTLTATPVKTITYDRLTGDYKMELDGEFVGYAACYHAAEAELGRLAYEQLDRAGIEPELLQSATALDGGSSQDEIAAEYTEALPVLLDGAIDKSNRRACPNCGGTNIDWSYKPPRCLFCDPDYDIGKLRKPATETLLSQPNDDQPTDDHNLVTPDPAECPSTTGPQPCEDCPTCGSDGSPCVDCQTVDPDNILAPSWPAPSSNTSCFILPSGDPVQSIILCIGGVSRVVSAQGVAEALALASVHTQPRSTITIVLTSQSAIKLRALEAALADMDITANVIAVKTTSGVNEQPIGDETRRGALNRIAAAREQVVGDLYVSIENGLFHEDGVWTDRAVCVVERPGNAHVPIVVSDGCVFPLDAVEEAQRRGFATTTVGQILAERGVVGDHADPHIDLCGTSRETFLCAAVRQALASVLT